MSKGMSVGVMIARVLLGLPFTVFGANGILHFFTPPPPTGHAAEFLGALAGSGYLLQVMGFFQLLGGIAVLSGRFLPLGLVLLAPILINIDLFHIMLEPHGAGMGLFLTALTLFLAWVYRASYKPLFNASLKAAS